jgi:GDP-4-dehydro-6-deoxy-D-mannose reductase
MSRVLITGAGGFLGSHLIESLRRHGPAEVIGVDLHAESAPGFDGWQQADLRDAASAVRTVFRAQPDIVFHLAGAFGGPANLVHASNVTTTEQVLSAVQAATPNARVVVIGSAAEYGRVPADAQPACESFLGHPVSDYGRAKRAVSELASRYATDFAMQVVIARPFNVVGRGITPGLVVGAIAQPLRTALAAPAPRSITIGTTDSVRDFIAAADVTDGLVLAAERGAAGESYNLCTGVGTSVQAVLEQLIAFTGEPIAVERDETLIRSAEVDALVGDSAKARAALGWRPTRSLESALRDAWDGSAILGAAA